MEYVIKTKRTFPEFDGLTVDIFITLQRGRFTTDKNCAHTWDSQEDAEDMKNFLCLSEEFTVEILEENLR